MTRLLPVLLILAISIYAFVDCARTPQESIQKLPKWAWILAILIAPFAIGGIAWLLVGRSRGLGGPRGGRGKIIPPDDDPDFLRNL
jgi:hypothetical protein